MKTLDILEALDANNSRLFKEEFLQENSTNEFLKTVFVAALDPYVTYNVKKFKLPKALTTSDEAEEGFESFVTNVLPILAERQVTGNDAKSLVETSFANMTKKAQKWAKRVLIKNLRVGVQTKTVNKVWSDIINVFAVQLARSLDTSHDENGVVINEALSYPVSVEAKLDGLRCVVVKHKGEVSMFTRNGRMIETLPTIKNILEKAPYDNVVLDGEAKGIDWNESASIIGSKKNVKDDSQMLYNVFDAIKVEDWFVQSCNDEYETRRKRLENIVNTIGFGSDNICLVRSTIVHNEKELLNEYERCLDLGHEGVMIKDIKGLYTFKRSDAMLKMKPITTYEGVVVGHYLGRDGTRHLGAFGGFNVLLPNGVVTRVGGGFSDVQRVDFLLTGYDSFVGKIAEVEGQPPLTNEGKIRFPVFKRWRQESDVDPKIMQAYDEFIQKQSAIKQTPC